MTASNHTTASIVDVIAEVSRARALLDKAEALANQLEQEKGLSVLMASIEGADSHLASAEVVLKQLIHARDDEDEDENDDDDDD